MWLIRAAAIRGQWIDQSQSLNLYAANITGPKLQSLYFAAWELGLKTTYYLRTLAATGVDKATDTGSKSHLRPQAGDSAHAQVALDNSCGLNKDDCPACQ